jgi:inosine/xanthosine triphosphate pyrophosphatase family protein
MTLAEKNRTSHRYRALIEMRELMLRLGLVRETRSP